VSPGQLDHLVLQDAEVCPVCPEFPDQKDTEDFLALMGPKERWVDLESKERTGLLDLWDLLVLSVPLVPEESEDVTDHLDHPD